MPLTLGLTGMDPATETALKAAFTHANARIGSLWQLVPETEAEHVMVDMDSMYGPMSWLRLHAAGKHVIGLTTAPRTQTDFRLGRPFDSDSFSALLRDVAAQGGVSTPEPVDVETAPAAAPASPAQADVPPAAAPAVALPVAAMPAVPAPTESANDAPPAASPRESTATVESAAPTPDPMPASAEAATSDDAAPQAPAPAPQASPAREPRLGDWLAPGALDRRVRYRSGGNVLLIDPAARSYHGPAMLKPLAASLQDTVRREDFEAAGDADWARESAAAGAAQPLLRLQWLDALLAGKGSLLPGHDPDGRYKLNKWPQTEREYPKHFRIATAMMKGPATLQEIAEASGMPVSDVADFVNASLATGFADLVPDVPVEAVEPARPTGLFGRLRGK